MNLIETYGIKRLKSNGAVEANLKKLEEKFDCILQSIEEYTLIDSDEWRALTKESIRSKQNEIERKLQSMVSLKWITCNLPAEDEIEIDVFEGFTFECENEGIKVYSRGKSKKAFVSFNGGKPMEYSFASLSEIKDRQ